MQGQQELLRAENIDKSFGMLAALKGVHLSLNKGEVLGLIGDNGAGKTTLFRVLCGIYQPDSGSIYFEGEKVRFRSIRDALRKGIAVIHQDLALLENLSITENLFLARELAMNSGPIRFADRKGMSEQAGEVLRNFGFGHIPPDTLVRNLSGGQRQSIAISRGVHFGAKLILMDEPTTNLSLAESDFVLNQVRELKARKTSVIIVTHNLVQLFPIADRFVILERGSKVAERKKSETDIEELARLIRGLPSRGS